MTVSTFFTQLLQVEKITGESRDEIGGSAPATSSQVAVMGYLEPSSSEEDLASRNTQIGDWLAFVPVDTDVTGWDRIIFGTHTFDIDGPPEPFHHPTSPGLDHIRLNLREVT